MSKRILIIDDDSSFTSAVVKIGSANGYSINTASSIKEANSLMKSHDFDAYIIEGDLPDGNGIDFYKELIEKKPEHTKFAFVSRSYKGAKDFSFLKGELGFDVVLSKPLSPSSSHSLLKILVEDPILTEDELLFEDMGKTFQESAPVKIGRLSDLVIEYYRSGDVESIIEFKKTIHRLAGTASSFGLGQVTEMCRRLDTRLVDLEEKRAFYSLEREELTGFIDELIIAFQFPNWTRSQVDDSEELDQDLVLISADLSLIARFQKISINHHLHLKIINELAGLRWFDSSPVDSKSIIIFDTQLWCESEGFNNWHKKIKNVYKCILIVKEDVKDSILIDHLEVGEVNILPYESNLRYLTWFLYQQIHHPMKVYKRVLVWGSESDRKKIESLIGDKIKSNVEWRAVDEAYQILKIMNPLIVSIVVIWDSEVENFKKIKHLRADEQSTNIKVLVVAKEYEPLREFMAIEAGANAFFVVNQTKTISQWINSQLNLEVAQASKINKQGSNGVLSFGGFLYRGLETLSKSVRTNDRFIVVRIGIRNCNKLIDSYGQAFVMSLMAELGFEMSERFRLSDLVAVSQVGEFIALLDGANKKDAYPLIERIITDLTYKMSERPERCELTASMVSFPEDGASLNLLLNRSRDVFKRSMLGEEGAVLKWSESHREQIHRERGILIVEPDEELGGMLEFSFKAKGWPVIKVNNGEEAYKVVQNGYKPIMILSERTLPEGDGVSLLKKINSFSETRFQWFFLTTKGTNEDIVYGLKAGAKDYIVKPFNLEVLMAKIKNLLEH